MAHALNHALATPQPGIGKGRVGEKSPFPGRKGITIAVALFFDGTLNNRSNTNKRLNTHGSILDNKDKNGRSSYGGFYSNVAVMEYLNLRRDPAKKEVSVYVEGIGTVDYSEQEEKAGKPRAAISNDDQDGFAFGTGFTGVHDRVTEGIKRVKIQINNPVIYKPKDFYIKKIEIDVIGFSRGSAAARHFVSRRAELQGPWRGGERPEIVINFVGLYDTVSSYEAKGNQYANAADKLTEGSFDRGLFEDDVKELNLGMYGVPKRVVHLTAADEYRSNFALTNIKSSLDAGVGFELELPGVHSDIGGGYVEPDPNNPQMDPKGKIRALNQEVRYFLTEGGMRESILRGWYLPQQLVAWYPENLKVQSRQLPFGIHTPQMRVQGGYKGSRYLANQYQYVALFIMLDFAQNGACRKGGKAHTEMRFESLALSKNTRYRVPADLVKLRDQFLQEAIQHTGSRQHGQVQLLHQQVLPPTLLPAVQPEPPVMLAPTTPPALRRLRNKYLHISAHTIAEGKDAYMGMDGNFNGRRVVILDTVRVDKFSKPYIDKAKVYRNHPAEIPKDVRRKLGELWDRL